MFNNKLIRNTCLSSSESNFQLSSEDWSKVLKANSVYSEDYDSYLEIYKNSGKIGQSLLQKIGLNHLDLSNSLELCCGSGYLYFLFQDIVTYGKNSYFIDISNSQCEHFKQRLLNNNCIDPLNGWTEL